MKRAFYFLKQKGKMQQGNFEALFEQIRQPLKMMVKRLNGHHQELDDEDLFQEASIHLWQRLSNNELFDKNKSYILKSCYFHLKNYLRNKSFSHQLTSLDEPIDENGTKLMDILSNKENPEKSDLENNILIEEINKCNLTNREKDVLRLYLEALTTREIASRLKISHVRVVKLMSRIKDKYKNKNCCYQNE